MQNKDKKKTVLVTLVQKRSLDNKFILWCCCCCFIVFFIQTCWSTVWRRMKPPALVIPTLPPSGSASLLAPVPSYSSSSFLSGNYLFRLYSPPSLSSYPLPSHPLWLNLVIYRSVIRFLRQTWDRKTDRRQTDIQTDRQKQRRTDRRTDRQTDR